MTAPTDFPQYKILQIRKGKLPGVGKLVRGFDVSAFGVEVRTGRAVVLNGDPLRARLGERWLDELRREVGREMLEIFGIVDIEGDVFVKSAIRGHSHSESVMPMSRIAVFPKCEFKSCEASEQKTVRSVPIAIRTQNHPALWSRC